MKNKIKISTGIILIFILVNVIPFVISLETFDARYKNFDFTSFVLKSENTDGRVFSGEGINLFRSSFDNSVFVTFEEHDSYLNIDGFKFENIKEIGVSVEDRTERNVRPERQSFIKLDENGKIIEVDLTTSGPTMFNFDGRPIRLGENTRVSYKNGSIEIFGGEEDRDISIQNFFGEHSLNMLISKGSNVKLTQSNDITFSGKTSINGVEFDPNPTHFIEGNIPASIKEHSAIICFDGNKICQGNSDQTEILFDFRDDTLSISGKGNSELEINADKDKLSGVFVNPINDNSKVQINLNDNGMLFKDKGSFIFSKNPPIIRGDIETQTKFVNIFTTDEESHTWMFLNNHIFDNFDSNGFIGTMNQIDINKLIGLQSASQDELNIRRVIRQRKIPSFHPEYILQELMRPFLSDPYKGVSAEELVNRIQTWSETRDYIMRHITPMLDIDNYGKEEYTASFPEINLRGREDCEGSAFVANSLLSNDLNYGLYLMFMGGSSGGHAVALVQDKRTLKYGSLGINACDNIIPSYDYPNDVFNEISKSFYGGFNKFNIYDFNSANFEYSSISGEPILKEIFR